ncbi:hypothetical protein SAMN04487983_10652 [Streptomyces sp. yr375]|nr:hypothetical protein SAMN04487983_10652 [Streptomyces sp. yr375]
MPDTRPGTDPWGRAGRTPVHLTDDLTDEGRNLGMNLGMTPRSTRVPGTEKYRANREKREKRAGTRPGTPLLTTMSVAPLTVNGS